MNRRTILIVAILNSITILIVALMLRATLTQASPNAPVAVPSTISYQGYLATSEEEELGETVNLSFEIYTAEEPTTGETPIWTEAPQAVDLDEGYFSVILGKTTPFQPQHFQYAQLWLQINIVNDATTTSLPRQPITSVPYAIQASNADTLDGIDSADLPGFTIYDRLVFNQPGLTGDQVFTLTEYGIPTGVKAVLVELLCQWPTETIGVCYLKSGSMTSLNVNKEDVVDTALVPIIDDTLTLQVNGATTEISLRILGYIE